MLPSQYISAEGLSGTNCYFNTGVNPTSDMNITGLFYCSPNTTATYLFGSRRQNSTSSDEQLNFLQRASGGSSFIGFAGARLELSENPVETITYIEKYGRNFIVLVADDSVFEKTGASTTFTGHQPMYILALNNAGSVSYGSDPSQPIVYAFKIESSSGVLQHNYVPCYDTVNQQFGLYDTAVEGGNFLTNQGTGTLNTLYLLEVQSSVGGSAYINSETAGRVKKQYRINSVVNLVRRSDCVAVPEKGYVFLNWTDGDGNIISTEDTFNPVISADTVITANFVKETNDDMNVRFQLLGLEYGASRAVSSGDPHNNLSNIYAFVKSFNCKEDALARATTTIEVDDVPDEYQANMPVLLISPKGKVIWCGIINSIQEKTITCREPLSIFDSDMICNPSNSLNGDNLTNRSIIYGTWIYYFYHFARANNKETAATSYFLSRMLREIQRTSESKLSFNRNKNIIASFPLITETAIANVEDKLFELFDQFGIVAESYLFKAQPSSSYPEKGIKNLLAISIKNPRTYETITMGDNIETISNIQLTEENQNGTCLLIYNSTGATFRGAYAMKLDGTLVALDDPSSVSNPSQYIAYNECKNKVVMSDDKVTTIAEQNLGNAMFNHKITMDVDILNGMFKFDDFKLGRRVDFYYKGKVYRSVVTGKEFSKDENSDKIALIKVTLGNVRTNLTTKLNIGKTKKK